jgi:hypothetical protein
MAPSLTLRAVPNLTNLGKILGFEKGVGRRSLKELAESTQQWRRQYICDDGTSGTGLVDRKSDRVRAQLKTMTLEYLDRAGYGRKWWPYSTDAKDLQWCRNKDKDRYVDHTS